MIRRSLVIGNWVSDFMFATDRYDIDDVLSCLYDAGAPEWALEEAEDLMENCDYNCGFTYSGPQRYRYINAKRHRAVVLIGPAESGAEFLDTFTHELYHLVVAIASEMGVDLEGEAPAYIAGDSARELAEVVCRLGCDHCSKLRVH